MTDRLNNSMNMNMYVPNKRAGRCMLSCYAILKFNSQTTKQIEITKYVHFWQTQWSSSIYPLQSQHENGSHKVIQRNGSDLLFWQAKTALLRNTAPKERKGCSLMCNRIQMTYA